MKKVCCGLGEDDMVKKHSIAEMITNVYCKKCGRLVWKYTDQWKKYINR